MAKTLADLKKSRRARQKIVEKYGEVPSSVWIADYSEGKQILDDTIGPTSAARKRNAQKLDDQSLLSAFGVSGRSMTGKNNELSRFPYNILRRAVLFYTNENDVVLDPFAGHNSRMQGVWELNRSYIGYDVCHEFMEFNRATADKIRKLDKRKLFSMGSGNIVLHEQSSEEMVEDDDSVDFIFTSPPYWDLEFYDDSPDQLGYNHTYDEFLDGLERVIQECLCVLKPGKLCVFNVNDFRKAGRFYPYHADVINLFMDAGFDPFDTIIMVWSSTAIRSIFATQVEQDKKTGKNHEYLLVFRKPEK